MLAAIDTSQVRYVAWGRPRPRGSFTTRFMLHSRTRSCGRLWHDRSGSDCLRAGQWARAARKAAGWAGLWTASKCDWLIRRATMPTKVSFGCGPRPTCLAISICRKRHSQVLTQIVGTNPATFSGRIRRDAIILSAGSDDMFNCGGENIYPGEVEKVIERIPEVMQACVVPVNDEIKGQKPVAFVVLRAGLSDLRKNALSKTSSCLTRRPISIPETGLFYGYASAGCDEQDRSAAAGTDCIWCERVEPSGIYGWLDDLFDGRARAPDRRSAEHGS